MELHGDRNVKDDKAMIGGLGKIGDQSFMFIGQQKGYNTKTRQYRNFGMANPEGYRKALRLMKMAEKFRIPVVTLLDTPGAYPGLEAEERGQGEAIARNILEMTRLKTQIITIVIGEGASGGALGIGVGDRVYMMENTWYTVISPESCSSILWRSWEFKEQAAAALKLTGSDMNEPRMILSNNGAMIPNQLGFHPTMASLTVACTGLTKFCLDTMDRQFDLAFQNMLDLHFNKEADLDYTLEEADAQLRRGGQGVSGYFSPEQRKERIEKHMTKLRLTLDE